MQNELIQNLAVWAIGIGALAYLLCKLLKKSSNDCGCGNTCSSQKKEIK